MVMNNEIYPPCKIYLSKSNIPKAGRGVFASTLIKKGEIIEICPVISLKKKDHLIAKKTILKNYYYIPNKSSCFVCLGFGSLYNHSHKPNAKYKMKIKEQVIEFIALKDIEKGEEITINYGAPEDKTLSWMH